jgi:uncharacterized protein
MTNIIHETYERLNTLYRQRGMPAGELVRVGVKSGWSVVIGTLGQCGMAMNFTGWESNFGDPRLDIGRLQATIGRSLLQVAGDYLDAESWQERAIGVAALSALSQPWIAPAELRQRGFAVLEGNTDFAALVRPDDVVAVVGYNGGVKRLLGKCRELHVTDMRPRQAFQTLVIDREVTFTPAEVIVHSEMDNRNVLSKATAVSITGSAFVNGTFDELLGYARAARLISVYGSSASLIPDALFAAGVHAVMTYQVTDAARLEAGMFNDMNMEKVVQESQARLVMVAGTGA